MLWLAHRRHTCEISWGTAFERRGCSGGLGGDVASLIAATIDTSMFWGRRAVRCALSPKKWTAISGRCRVEENLTEIKDKSANRLHPLLLSKRNATTRSALG